VIKRYIKQYPLLVLIILLALIIRLVAGYIQSFSNDELSALYRLQFNNFYDFIHWGVKVDGHPALVQLLLYVYTPFCGKSELMIRLPFILASTFSLVYIFFLFKKLSGEFTAYMVVIILAFAGFSIQLGYFARPYALGILFTSMAAYYWVKFFIDGDKNKKYFIFFIVTSILACYTHYFALLQIFMLGIATFLFTPVKTWWKMFLAGVIILILYLPNYPILAFQLSVGGIGGWLGKPKNYFIIDVVLLYFDKNPVIIATFVLLVMLLVIKGAARPILKRVWLFLFLSITPYLLLYIYSIKINSLLQYSACFFFIPFLLAAFFSLFEGGKQVQQFIKWGYVTAIVIFLGSVFIFNPAFAPIHFGEFKRIAKYINENESDSVTTVVAVNNPFYIDWYLQDKKPDLYITDMGDNLSFLRRFIDTCKTPEFIYAFSNQRSNGEIPFIIADKYNYWLDSRYYMNAELYHYKYGLDVRIPKELQMRYEYFQGSGKFENNIGCIPPGGFVMNEADVYSPTFELSTTGLNKNSSIVASVSSEQKNSCDMEFVISIEGLSGDVFWRSRKFSQQGWNPDTLNSHKRFIISENLNNAELKGAKLKVYIINSSHCSCYFDSFNISFYTGNPYTSVYSQ